MTNCLFCTLPELKDRTIVRNDLAWAFLTNIPITPGHTLVAPVRHVEKFDELTADEKNAIFALTHAVKMALTTLFSAGGFHCAWNENKVAGQSVPHFHLHVVPRKQGDEGITEYEPRKFLYRPGSREVTSEGELRTVTNLIKSAME